MLLLEAVSSMVRKGMNLFEQLNHKTADWVNLSEC